MSKSLKLKSLLLCILALGGLPFAENPEAATIALTDGATVYDPITGEANGTGAIAVDQDNVVQDTLTSGTSAAVSASIANTTTQDGQTQTGEASSSASVDSVTGVMKVSANTSFDGYYASAGTHASAIASIGETFTAVGSGTISALMAIDGVYSIATQTTIFPGDGTVIPPGPISFQISADLSLSTGATGNGEVLYDPMNDCSLITCTSKSGTISDTLNASLFVSDGTNVTLSARLVVQIINGAGFLDLGHTALLFFSTTPGLTLVPNDSRFLSGPAFNASPVPVPAALPLLAAGLSAMGFMGWRRKRKAVA